MVKMLLFTLILILPLSCSFRPPVKESKVVFREMPITERDKRHFESDVRTAKEHLGKDFFDRNGLYILYKTNCSQCHNDVVVYYFPEEGELIQGCYTYFNERAINSCQYFKGDSAIIQIFKNLDAFAMPRVITQLNNWKSSDIGGRVVFWEKHNDNYRFNVHYDAEQCMPGKCMPGISTKTLVPKKYAKNVLLYRIVSYFGGELTGKFGIFPQSSVDSAKVRFKSCLKCEFGL